MRGRAGDAMMADGALRSATAGFSLRVHSLPGSAIVRDYIAGRDLSTFFSGHYGDPAAYARKAAEVEARMDPGARLHAAPAIEPLGDSASRLERIIAGDGFFITTGQQPALFGGPLYTLLKIFGAIRLAEQAEKQLGKPVLALFWVGSDDHDWAEANHAWILDGAKYARRIEVGADPDAPPVPLYRRAWGPEVLRAVEEFTALLPPTESARDVARHIRDEYTPYATVSASFTATMRWLLRDRRVALVDSAHPALRRAAAPIMAREVERSARHNRLIAEQTRRLEQAGYAAQVTPADEAANLMHIDAFGRDRLVRTERGWTTRRSDAIVAENELLRDIEADPDSYSPNVMLRPVVENAVFPTIAYVAGPGELSYFGQIGCLFAAHEILVPVIVPRPSLTVIDEKVARKLARLDIELETLARPFADIVADVVHASIPSGVREVLTTLRADLKTQYEQLARAAESVDPTLRGPLIAARNRALLESNAVEKKIVSRLRRRNETAIEQLRRLAAALYPEGAPQERKFGPLPLIAAYGPGILDELLDAARIDAPTPASWTGPDCAAVG